MTEILPIDGRQGPTAKGQGPTPKGQGPTFNAYRHGLTGQLNIITPEEQQAYDKHSKITLEALAPATDFERALAQSIADDLWRLNRVRTIEHGMFAIGMQHGVDNTGSPQADDALAQARTWMHESRSLQLLTIYEQRIRRAVDKAISQLESFQTKREIAVKEDMRQAKLLMQLAQAEGKPYQPEAYFTTVPLARESVFSTTEVVRELSRDELFGKAWDYGRPSILRKKQALAQEAPASACESLKEQIGPPIKQNEHR